MKIKRISPMKKAIKNGFFNAKKKFEALLEGWVLLDNETGIAIFTSIPYYDYTSQRFTSFVTHAARGGNFANAILACAGDFGSHARGRYANRRHAAER